MGGGAPSFSKAQEKSVMRKVQQTCSLQVQGGAVLSPP